MGKVMVDITVSLDGFIAGPNINAQQPLGEGGLRLHDWMFGVVSTAIDKQMLNEMGVVIALNVRTKMLG